MSAKHTPGPWHVGNSVNGNMCIWGDLKHRQDGYFECCVCAVSPVSKITKIDDANAHLIAAAPDLLEAFKVSLIRAYTAGYMHGHEATIEGGFISVHHSDETEFHAENIHQMLCDGSLPEASAAIAKAKGEAK